MRGCLSLSYVARIFISALLYDGDGQVDCWTREGTVLGWASQRDGSCLSSPTGKWLTSAERLNRSSGARSDGQWSSNNAGYG